MSVIFSKISWEDYISWQKEDKNILKKINQLIKKIKRYQNQGNENKESLKYELTGFWSRRLDHEHRLVYQGFENELLIYSCKYHYDK